MKNLLFLFAFIPLCLFSQHSIQGTFSPAKDFTYALLYKANPTSLNYLDRGKVDEEGHFKIELDTTVTAGMYKIVYGVPEKENNLDFIYDGKESIVLTFSLDEGLEFKESVENKLWASYTKSMELVNMTISNFYTQESTDESAFKNIFKTLKDTQEAFEDAAKGTMAATFIKANRPYIPTNYENVQVYANNLKTNFLKNVDFENTLLQSSDFLTDRVMAYVFGMSATNSNEDYKQHIDEVVTAIGNNQPNISASLLENIWYKMTSLENNDVANYISDTYLLQLSNNTGNKKLYDALVAYKNNAPGAIAQDFPITYKVEGKPVNTSLHNLGGADHYLLIFWSSTCSHCLNELPQLQKYVSEHPKNLKIIAFGIEDEKEAWEKTIPQFPKFIHVLGLGHWDNPIAKAYDVNTTPTYLILDKDKKIIAKPEDVDAVEDALEEMK